MGDGYLFFDIVEPEDLQYTFKINPAAFGPEWVRENSQETQMLTWLVIGHVK